MRRFTEVLKTGDMRPSAKRGNSNEQVPDKASDTASKLSVVLKTGNLRPQKRPSSGPESKVRASDSKSTVRQSLQNTSAASTTTAGSPHPSRTHKGGLAESPWIPPSQRRAATQVSRSSNHSANGELNPYNSNSFYDNTGDSASASAASAGSAASPNERDGGHVPDDSTAFNQDDRYSIVSRHRAGGGPVVPMAPLRPANFPPPPQSERPAPGFAQDDFSDDDEPIPRASATVVGGGAVSDGKSRATAFVGGVPGDSVSEARVPLSDGMSADDGYHAVAPIFVQKTLAPYRPVPGDDESVNTPATRYTFETSTMSWKSQEIFLRVLHPNRGYDQDDLHVCFAVEQVVNAATSIPMVAKMFRRLIQDVREDDYFGEGQCQAMTETFARQFNRLRPRPGEEKPILPLLTCRTVVRISEANIPVDQMESKTGFYSYRTSDTNEIVFMMEPNTIECMQTGVSFSSDMNMTSYPPLNISKPAIKELAEAFSHFSFAQSAEQLLVTGLQRYAGYLVDPLVYTSDKKGYGMANSGERGIASWREKHVCNPLCRVIGLRPLEEETTQNGTATAKAADKENSSAKQMNDTSNFYAVLSKHVIDYRDACVPQKEKALPERTSLPPAPTKGREPLIRTKEGKKEKEGKKAKEKPSVPADPVEVAVEPPTHADPVVEAAKPPTHAEPVAPPPVAPPPVAAPPVVAPPVVAPPVVAPPVVAPPVVAPPVVAPPTTTTAGEPKRMTALAPASSGNGNGSNAVTLRGCKYVFVAETQRWFPEEVQFVVSNPDRPITRDRRSKVFALEQDFGNGITSKMLGRVLSEEDVSDANYFSIMDAYVLCSTLANAFNEYKKSEIFKKFVHFMERHVVRVRASDVTDENWSRSFFSHPSTDSKDVLFLLEPENYQDVYERARTDYDIDRTNVDGYIDSDDDYGSPPSSSAKISAQTAAKNQTEHAATEWSQVLNTFYHFCYVRTGRYVCVQDAKFAHSIMPCENVGDAKVADGSLVNPCVHTFDGNGFECMNEGNSSVLQWARGHKCNALCGLLALPAVASTVPLNVTGGGKSSATKKDSLDIATLPRQVSMHYIYPATKYTFDPEKLIWSPTAIFVRVCDPNKGFAMGAMRVVFEVTECSSGLTHFETPYLAKLFRHNIVDVVERDYFNEGALQNLCYQFGRKFAEVAQECPALQPRGDTTQLEFVPISVVVMERETLPDELFTKRKGFFSYKTQDTQKIMFTIEEKIEGTFTKYNSNGTAIYATSETKLTPQESRRRTHILEAAEALSHYSLSESKGALLVCDIQGVGTKLTDPEVHTYNGQGLGIGNRGREGIADFVSRHRCNFVCKSLGLPTFQMRVPEVKDVSANPWATRLQVLQNMPTSTEGHPRASSSPH